MADRITVLLVDDHFVVRQGTAALLAGIEGVDIVGESENGREAVAKALELEPDVVLMDLVMPHKDGIEATRAILCQRPQTAILILTGSQLQQKILDAVRAGALGYLSKNARRSDFANAIRSVAQGEPWLPPEITRRLLGRLTESNRPAEPLTPREIDILRLVARGYSNQRIADTIYLAEVTVRSHVSRILGKLGLTNRVEAALWALREGVVAIEDA
jgi:NarL family two-component system response regulator LiaR